MNKEKDIDLESVYKCEDENTMKLYDGMLARYISEILLNIEGGYISEAEDWIKRAIERDMQNGMVYWHLAKDYVLYGELFKRKGDHSKSKENLNKAIEIFKECGADGWVEKVEETMVSLS
jgi:tetratricopeptide (TPR) repeat protein